ncbi:MAG: diadenylate cyclase CdaA [Candidatus Atribacteria bacterium]|nr:diadenylate cyclase CdaA [Candidatus Atribacteria bacterium]MCD6350121.1 diadenylate cyclase CdaA [Candidatus Atribacteria bacterium]
MFVLSWRQIFEFIILYCFIFYVLRFLRGTPLITPLNFLSFILIVASVSNYAGLKELNFFWKVLLIGYVASMLIIFQPEIRRIYTNRAYNRETTAAISGLLFHNEELRTKLIEDLVITCQTLSRKKIGALIVLERSNSLKDFVQTGILIDALFSPELAISIFLTESPLHDGAVILRENRLIAAGCILPLAEVVEGKKLVGTRHRAGIGITEQTDALAIVVSEETAKISLAVHGKMAWGIEAPALKKMLKILYRKV